MNPNEQFALRLLVLFALELAALGYLLPLLWDTGRATFVCWRFSRRFERERGTRVCWKSDDLPDDVCEASSLRHRCWKYVRFYLAWTPVLLVISYCIGELPETNELAQLPFVFRVLPLFLPLIRWRERP